MYRCLRKEKSTSESELAKAKTKRKGERTPTVTTSSLLVPSTVDPEPDWKVRIFGSSSRTNDVDRQTVLSKLVRPVVGSESRALQKQEPTIRFEPYIARKATYEDRVFLRFVLPSVKSLFETLRFAKTTVSGRRLSVRDTEES